MAPGSTRCGEPEPAPCVGESGYCPPGLLPLLMLLWWDSPDEGCCGCGEEKAGNAAVDVGCGGGALGSAGGVMKCCEAAPCEPPMTYFTAPFSFSFSLPPFFFDAATT